MSCPSAMHWRCMPPPCGQACRPRCTCFRTAATASARAALQIALETLLRLFAPAFATDEVWSWWREGSVHAQAWPASAPLAKAAAGQDASLLRVVSEAIISVRKVKSDAKVSQKTPMLHATLALPEAAFAEFESVRFDVCALGSIEELTLEASTDGAITLSKVELGEPPAKKK